MPASLSDWVERLSAPLLPSLPSTVHRVRELMANASTTHADYQRIVARDPGFALSIFRYLGDLPRPPREPITQLAHAIALAGLAPLQAGTKDSVPLLQQRPEGSAWSGLQRGYSRAAHAARYAFDLGRQRGDANPDELMLAALLSECGELALWAQIPAQMQAIEQAVGAGRDRDQSAQETLGCTLPQLNSALAEAWSLPPLVRQSQPYAGAFQPRSLGVMLAAALARSSEQDWGSSTTLELIELSAEYANTRFEVQMAETHRSAVYLAQRLEELPLTAPALLGLQGDRAEQPAPEPAPSRATHRRGKVAAEESPTPPPPAAAISFPSEKSPPQESRTPSRSVVDRPRASRPLPRGTDCREPSSAPEPIASDSPVRPQREPQPTASTHPAPSSGKPRPAAVNAPTQPQDEAGSTTANSGVQPLDDERLRAALTQLFRRLRHEAGLTRVVFAMVTPDRKALRTRFVVGAAKEAPLRRFRVDLEQRSLFTALLAKPQSFWFGATNHDKYLPAIPGELQRAVELQGFFATALFAEARPLGLIYGDNEAALDRAQFDRFRTACEQLQATLETPDPAALRALG